jgi:hypothetical protein
MNEEYNENNSDLNDAIPNSSDSDDNMRGSRSDPERIKELNYGDIIIMIWRRVKFNERISAQLRR